MQRRIRFQTIPVLLLLILPVFAQQQTDPSLLTVDSLFTFRTRSLGPVQWQNDGSGYLALEPSPTKKNFLDIVRYDVATGDRTVKVSAEKLTPSGASEPIAVEEFSLTADEQKLLIFTNSARVWRSQHSRRLLGLRSQSAKLQETRWCGRKTVDADVRQVFT